jgi:sulfatase modifying factor 1
MKKIKLVVFVALISLITIKLSFAPPAARTTGKVLPNMVLVPAGDFMMGCNYTVDNVCGKDERPYHKVYLDAFHIDKYDVTNAQYGQCVSAGSCSANDKFVGLTDPQQPVVGVDWNQADVYCKWAGKRLPTEAQWEKAARGTDGRKYPWGNQEPTCDLAVFYSVQNMGCGRNSTWPVGSKPAGASPYGAMDMAGNMWNWVSDRYDENYYQSSPNRNPTGPELYALFAGVAGTTARSSSVRRPASGAIRRTGTISTGSGVSGSFCFGVRRLDAALDRVGLTARFNNDYSIF